MTLINSHHGADAARMPSPMPERFAAPADPEQIDPPPDPRSPSCSTTATPGPHDRRERLARLRGALRLTRAGVELAADIAEDVHTAIAAPLAIIDDMPAVRAAREIHDGVRSGVYACIRAVNRLLFDTLERALTIAGPAIAPPEIPGPLVGLLHGILGDRLTRTRNPMRTAMHLRHRGRRLVLSRSDLATALPRGDAARLVVFVHGLAADETCWRRGAARSFGRPDVDYGDLLAASHGVTPLYLRYNSGLRISANGRALADLLRRLYTNLAGPPPPLVLVGHSMGGLVVRSACHHASQRGDAWAASLTDIVCLGAPHRGSYLEQFGVAATAALHTLPVTAPIARTIDLRSAGIKDLRHGTTRDAPGEEARLPHARYHDLAGKLRTPSFAWAVGDGLVRPRSAAPDDPDIHRTTHAGVGHVAMLAHPTILAHLAEILGPALAARP